MIRRPRPRNSGEGRQRNGRPNPSLVGNVGLHSFLQDVDHAASFDRRSPRLHATNQFFPAALQRVVYGTGVQGGHRRLQGQTARRQGREQGGQGGSVSRPQDEEGNRGRRSQRQVSRR